MKPAFLDSHAFTTTITSILPFPFQQLFTLLLFLTLAISQSVPTSTPPEDTFSIRIFYTGSIYGGILPLIQTRTCQGLECPEILSSQSTDQSILSESFGGCSQRAAFLRAMRLVDENSIALDVGSYTFSSLFPDEIHANCINTSQYDVINLGVTDLYKGTQAFSNLAHLLDFDIDIVSSNVVLNEKYEAYLTQPRFNPNYLVGHNAHNPTRPIGASSTSSSTLPPNQPTASTTPPITTISTSNPSKNALIPSKPTILPYSLKTLPNGITVAIIGLLQTQSLDLPSGSPIKPRAEDGESITYRLQHSIFLAQDEYVAIQIEKERERLKNEKRGATEKLNMSSQNIDQTEQNSTIREILSNINGSNVPGPGSASNSSQTTPLSALTSLIPPQNLLSTSPMPNIAANTSNLSSLLPNDSKEQGTVSLSENEIAEHLSEFIPNQLDLVILMTDMAHENALQLSKQINQIDVVIAFDDKEVLQITPNLSNSTNGQSPSNIQNSSRTDRTESRNDGDNQHVPPSSTGQQNDSDRTSIPLHQDHRNQPNATHSFHQLQPIEDNQRDSGAVVSNTDDHIAVGDVLGDARDGNNKVAAIDDINKKSDTTAFLDDSHHSPSNHTAGVNTPPIPYPHPPQPNPPSLTPSSLTSLHQPPAQFTPLVYSQQLYQQQQPYQQQYHHHHHQQQQEQQPLLYHDQFYQQPQLHQQQEVFHQLQFQQQQQQQQNQRLYQNVAQQLQLDQQLSQISQPQYQTQEMSTTTIPTLFSHQHFHQQPMTTFQLSSDQPSIPSTPSSLSRSSSASLTTPDTSSTNTPVDPPLSTLSAKTATLGSVSIRSSFFNHPIYFVSIPQSLPTTSTINEVVIQLKIPLIPRLKKNQLLTRPNVPTVSSTVGKPSIPTPPRLFPTPTASTTDSTNPTATISTTSTTSTTPLTDAQYLHETSIISNIQLFHHVINHTNAFIPLFNNDDAYFNLPSGSFANYTKYSPTSMTSRPKSSVPSLTNTVATLSTTSTSNPSVSPQLPTSVLQKLSQIQDARTSITNLGTQIYSSAVELEKSLLTVVGHTTAPIPFSTTLTQPNVFPTVEDVGCDNFECALGNLLLRGYLLSCLETHGALCHAVVFNSGTLFAPIQGPDVTMQNLRKAYPFNNIVVVIEVTGDVIRKALIHSAESQRTVRYLHTNLHVVYSLDTSLPGSERLVELKIPVSSSSSSDSSLKPSSSSSSIYERSIAAFSYLNSSNNANLSQASLISTSPSSLSANKPAGGMSGVNASDLNIDKGLYALADVNDNAVYTLALPLFLYNGAEGYTMFKNIPILNEIMVPEVDLVINYFNLLPKQTYTPTPSSSQLAQCLMNQPPLSTTAVKSCRTVLTFKSASDAMICPTDLTLCDASLESTLLPLYSADKSVFDQFLDQLFEPYVDFPILWRSGIIHQVKTIKRNYIEWQLTYKPEALSQGTGMGVILSKNTSHSTNQSIAGSNSIGATSNNISSTADTSNIIDNESSHNEHNSNSPHVAEENNDSPQLSSLSAILTQFATLQSAQPNEINVVTDENGSNDDKTGQSTPSSSSAISPNPASNSASTQPSPSAHNMTQIPPSPPLLTCDSCSSLGFCEHRVCTCLQPIEGLFKDLPIITGASCSEIASIWTLPLPLKITFFLLGAFTIILSLFCAILITFFSSHPAILAISPRFAVIMCFGSLLAAIGIMLNIDPYFFNVPCMAPVWFLTIGYIISFGTLFLRTFRLSKIFNSDNIVVNTLLFNDFDLFKRLAVFIAADLLILTFFHAFDPLAYTPILLSGPSFGTDYQSTLVNPGYAMMMVGQQTSLTSTNSTPNEFTTGFPTFPNTVSNTSLSQYSGSGEDVDWLNPAQSRVSPTYIDVLSSQPRHVRSELTAQLLSFDVFSVNNNRQKIGGQEDAIQTTFQTYRIQHAAPCFPASEATDAGVRDECLENQPIASAFLSSDSTTTVNTVSTGLKVTPKKATAVGVVTSSPSKSSGNEFTIQCQTNSSIPVIILLVYNGLMLAWGLYLAFRTRHLELAFNESIYISITIYNCAIVATIICIIQLVLSEKNPMVSSLIFQLAALFIIAFTLSIIYIPRLRLVYIYSDGWDQNPSDFIDEFDDKGDASDVSLTTRIGPNHVEAKTFYNGVTQPNYSTFGPPGPYQIISHPFYPQFNPLNISLDQAAYITQAHHFSQIGSPNDDNNQNINRLSNVQAHNPSHLTNSFTDNNNLTHPLNDHGSSNHPFSHPVPREDCPNFPIPSLLPSTEASQHITLQQLMDFFTTLNLPISWIPTVHPSLLQTLLENSSLLLLCYDFLEPHSYDIFVQLHNHTHFFPFFFQHHIYQIGQQIGFNGDLGKHNGLLQSFTPQLDPLEQVSKLNISSTFPLEIEIDKPSDITMTAGHQATHRASDQSMVEIEIDLNSSVPNSTSTTTLAFSALELDKRTTATNDITVPSSHHTTAVLSPHKTHLQTILTPALPQSHSFSQEVAQLEALRSEADFDSANQSVLLYVTRLESVVKSALMQLHAHSQRVGMDAGQNHNRAHETSIDHSSFAALVHAQDNNCINHDIPPNNVDEIIKAKKQCELKMIRQENHMLLQKCREFEQLLSTQQQLQHRPQNWCGSETLPKDFPSQPH